MTIAADPNNAAMRPPTLPPIWRVKNYRDLMIGALSNLTDEVLEECWRRCEHTTGPDGYPPTVSLEPSRVTHPQSVVEVAALTGPPNDGVLISVREVSAAMAEACGIIAGRGTGVWRKVQFVLASADAIVERDRVDHRERAVAICPGCDRTVQRTEEDKLKAGLCWRSRAPGPDEPPGGCYDAWVRHRRYLSDRGREADKGRFTASRRRELGLPPLDRDSV